MYAHINGEIMKEKEATISIFEHGFMYGLGAFETIRVYQGHPFLFHDHINRLEKSIAQLGIKMISDWREGILESVFDLLERNKLDNAYVRINISAGVGSLGLQVDQYEQPTIIIYTKPLALENDVQKEKALQKLTVRRNTPEGSFRIKSHHFLNNVLGKREVGNDTGIEGFFLTKEGYVAEGVVSNLFWVKAGVLYTPAISTGILGGITRKFILCLAKKQGIRIKVGKFTLEQLLSCDEAFVTNSIQEIVPVKKVQDRELLKINGMAQFFQGEFNKFRTTLWALQDLQIGDKSDQNS
jgi:4-amino-4-deoxychorismate lyase